MMACARSAIARAESERSRAGRERPSRGFMPDTRHSQAHLPCMKGLCVALWRIALQPAQPHKAAEGLLVEPGLAALALVGAVQLAAFPRNQGPARGEIQV